MKLNDTFKSLLLTLVFFTILGQSYLYLDRMPLLGKAYSILRFVFFFMGIALILKQKLNDFNLLLFAFFSTVLLSTFIHKGSFIPLISVCINVLTLLVFLDYGIKWNSKSTIKILANILNFYCIVGFITTVLWPNGLWLVADKGMKLFLLGGNYNSLGPRFLLALILNVLYYEKERMWLPVIWFMILISYISIWTVGSMTSLVGISIFTLYFIVRSRWSIDKIYVWIGFVVMVIAQIIFVFMHNEADVNPFSTFLVENVLNKSSDFTFRTGIWIRSCALFNKSIWIGYGIQGVDFYYAMIDGRTPHNFILNILLKGGIIGFSFFSLWIYTSILRANKYINKHSNLIEIGTLILFIMMLMEVYPFIFIFLLIFLLYKSSDL